MYIHYSTREYFEKQKLLNILPIKIKFDLNDLFMFHRIFHGLSVVKFPFYIVTYDRSNANERMFQRQTRQFNDSDRLKVRCTVTPKVNAFKNSFFHRTHTLWNDLPIELRSTEDPVLFKARLNLYLWEKLANDNIDSGA